MKHCTGLGSAARRDPARQAGTLVAAVTSPAKGANYILGHPSRVSPAHYEELIRAAAGAT
ncbi:MAG: hypothetical protein R2751_01150 [Bacteroidales bacterium]